MANVALYIAGSGLGAMQEVMNTYAQNAANLKTPAFKEEFKMTADGVYTQLKQAGIRQSPDTFESPVRTQRGSGAKVVGTTRIMTPGAFKQTTNPLDIAINGGGYFCVNLPGNVKGYTKNGTFKLSNGQLTTGAGYALSDDITIDTTKYNLNDVTITNDGTVTVTDNSTNPATIVPLGNIAIYLFPNEQALQDIGEGIALQAEAGDAVQTIPGQNNSGTLLHKQLEMSNVNSVEIMTGLIEANHNYELNSKIIMAVNDMEKSTNNMYK